MKTIYDPLHGFIKLNCLEMEWIKTPWFLRLQSIHQLGVAYRVFPGATHTRFEHSLGVMHLATKIFDHLFANLHANILDTAQFEFYRKIVRLAALSHDLGHLPFSHLAEKNVLQDDCHEAWTIKILQSKQVVNFLSSIIEEGKAFNIDALSLLIKIAVGEKKYNKYVGANPFSQIELILSEIITGDFFGADRMDYLLRDAKATGLSYGVFDHEQLIMSLLLEGKSSLSLMIDFKGIHACESLLVARYFMYERLYLNPRVQAYGVAMQYFVQKVIENCQGLKSVENYLKITDVEVLAYAHSEKENDPLFKKYRNSFFYHEDLIEVMPLSEKQLESLKNHQKFKEELIFKNQNGDPTFLAPDFYVKTPANTFIPFKNCSKLKIPNVNENFVLFEKTHIANVLEIIFQETFA